jgi:hypothetical protein
MTRISIALAVGLALIAIAAGVTLSRSPLTLASRAQTSEHTLISAVRPAIACQGGEVLPQGVTAIRLGLNTIIGPHVTLTVLSGSGIVTSGARAPGWSGASVVVPVQALSHATAPIRVCFTLTLMNGPVALQGQPTAPADAARSPAGPLPGRVNIEYLRLGHASWWSMVASTARHLGLGHAAAGTWNALLVMALVGGFISLSSWLVLRELR